MLKLKMMLCVMMLPLVVVGAHQSSLDRCIDHRLRRGCQPPRLADTAERDYFTPQRG